MSTEQERFLPDKELAYDYTVAMRFSQELEANLRAILHTVHHSFGAIDEDRTAQEWVRFGCVEKFLDKATIGTLTEKLRKGGITWTNAIWNLINNACALRNELAHRFLEELELPHRSDEARKDIVMDLRKKTVQLYGAAQITRAARSLIEDKSNEEYGYLNATMKRLGFEASEINRGIWENRNT